MKKMMAVMSLVVLVSGCRHAKPEATSEAYLRQHIPGTWYSGDRWVMEPFSFVTFFPDGHFTRSSTNGSLGILPSGYWRVSHTGAVTLTVDPGAPPAAGFEVFRVDRITSHEMVFTNWDEKLCITFTR